MFILETVGLMPVKFFSLTVASSKLCHHIRYEKNLKLRRRPNYTTKYLLYIHPVTEIFLFIYKVISKFYERDLNKWKDLHCILISSFVPK